MRTLTHVPLAMAGALIPVIAIAAALIVWVAVAIRTRLGRARPAEAGTESGSDVLGATGPGVVKLVSTTPGPALAALTPDSSLLPVDLTSEWWRANPTEPLAPSELVRWRNITGRYEVVGRVPVVPGRES